MGDVNPTTLGALLAAVGALTYVVRALVAKRASPEETVRLAILEVVRAIHRSVKDVAAEVSTLPKHATDCPWSQGRIPEHYDRFVHALTTELELALTRDRPGKHPKDR